MSMTYPLAPAVLIVEDETLIRIIAVEAFLDAGFIVLEAECAAHALVVLRGAAEVHLLFTDVNMPGTMTGIDLAEQLQAAKPRLHVIITSALPILRSISHMRATFVAKPYGLEAVCETARNLMAA
jgi:DNA-binding NtrC family response regulator